LLEWRKKKECHALGALDDVEHYKPDMVSENHL
jgi:hypothetical protein